MLSSKNFRELERDIQKAERRRDEDGRRHLNRHHIHDMALRQERESVLRAAGIIANGRVPIQDRLTNKFANRLGSQPKDKDPANDSNQARPDERERRTCNNCLTRGHLAKDCTNPTADKVKEALYLKSLKRSSVENEIQPDRPVLARTATTEAGRGRGYTRGGGRAGGRTAGRGLPRTRT